jgi:chromosome condensin MukBEF MukE localization factor
MGNYDVQNSSQFLDTRKFIDCLTNIVIRVLSYLLQQFVRIKNDGLFISQKDYIEHSSLLENLIIRLLVRLVDSDNEVYIEGDKPDEN